MQDNPLIVVGIGASAGGLEAFELFFRNMPAESGMAFLIVLHLPANRKSMLPEIIARWTDMPVLHPQHGEQIRPDRVYVLPPHTIASIAEGHITLREPQTDNRRDDRPIDGMFDALAVAYGQDAVGIVLSGSGTDGALGLKALKQAGGFAIVQGSDGSKPQYEGMPASSIATGAVDLIAPVEDIPGHLLRLRRQRGSGGFAEDVSSDHEAARLAICVILRDQLGHDFSGYKDKTFMRRVQRRMQVLDIVLVPDYINRLQADADEVVLLFRDLLIRVTSFFRDGKTFDALKQYIIPRLFKGKTADSAVRIWVPGCATGEEAYSLAILLREHMDGLRPLPRVQIFATDIDEPAISTARSGRYPATLLEGLSNDRRERFFNHAENSFVVKKEIRELCTFSPHSLVRDPPFSKMDFISCRNLLIYLGGELQAAVFPAFHYSLLPGGLLLLGNSETTARHEDLFTIVDKKHRIFQRRDVAGPPLHILRRNRPSHSAYGAARNTEPHWPGLTQMETGRLTHASRSVAPQAPKTDSRQGNPGAVLNRLQRLFAFATSSVAKLQQQLAQTRHKLQSMTERQETLIEELRSANQEMHSVNEELQSANEELETSKEEIQSVNEELHTVNAQLGEKVDELDRVNSDLKNLFDSTDVATIFLDRHLVIRGYTPAVGSIYNLIPSDQGRPITDIASQLNYTGLQEDVCTVLETLRPLERRVSHQTENRHYLVRILPYRTADSTVDGTLVTFLDVSSIVQAEQHQSLLVDELNHRVKNMLTVVVSLAAQTLRRTTSLDDFSKAFIGRVEALTASYSLLSRQNWTHIGLRDVVLEETRPYARPAAENVILQGEDVLLTPQGALALGMAFHELATNALKYGALSAVDGIVKITWDIEHTNGTRDLVVNWVESGGPPVMPPKKRGFGITLIERGITHELSGQVAVEFHEAGLQVRLMAPLDVIAAPPHSALA